MKNLGLFIVFLTVLSPAAGLAQGNKSDNVAAGVALGLGIFKAIQEIDRYYELLELQATQQVLDRYEDEQAFRVKVLKVDGEKITDIASESMFVFEINFYDRFTQQETRREVLFAFTSPGWVNEFGIEFSAVEWVWFDKEKWNNLLAEFIRISTPLTPRNGKVPYARPIDSQDYLASDGQFYLIRMGDFDTNRIEYYEQSSDSVPIANVRMKAKDFIVQMGDLQYGYTLTIPGYNIGRDQYLSAKIDDGITIVANEGALGFYRESVGRIVQLRRVMVNTIHEWMNTFVREVTSFDRLIQSNTAAKLDAMNAAAARAEAAAEANRRKLELERVTVEGKATFSAGDLGYIDIKGEWVRCAIASSRIDSVNQLFWVTVTFQADGKERTKTIQSNSSEVIWVTEWLED